MAAQVETKQHKKVTTPPKVEINKTPDNNMMLKQNSTGNSPPTAEATPPAGQQLEPFVGTPQQVATFLNGFLHLLNPMS